MEIKTETKITVRYCETDKMGIVHHSRYYPWFEIARADFIKSIGVSYDQMEKMGIMMPLTQTHAKYIEGLTYDEEAVVFCKLTKLTVVRCVFEYEVVRVRDNKTVTTGSTEHAFCNEHMRPINLMKKHPEIFGKIKEMVSDT